MAAKKRKRRVQSVKIELIQKSREAALTAIQIFNNPLIEFKSELFIVTMNIAWTYLLHAYYREKKVEYRYFQMAGTRRRFDRTKHGAYKYWELERCLNDRKNPLDKNTSNNLRFLIGIRHEIEHQMTTRLDNSMSAKYQACCLNYNNYVKKLFGKQYGLDQHLTFSLQLSEISREQVDALSKPQGLPKHIHAFTKAFEDGLTQDEYNSQQFAYRVLFVPKTAKSKGQADQMIEVLKPDSELAQDINRVYLKEVERPKYLPKQIVKMMKDEGYSSFTMHWHTVLWQEKDGRNTANGYGVWVAKQWYWYERWLDVVRTYCEENFERDEVDPDN